MCGIFGAWFPQADVGIGLREPRLSAGIGFQNLGRAFGNFSRVGKVTRRRQTSRFGGLTHAKTRCSLKTKKAGDPVDLQPFHAFVKDLPRLALAVAAAAGDGQHENARAI